MRTGPLVPGAGSPTTGDERGPAGGGGRREEPQVDPPGGGEDKACSCVLVMPFRHPTSRGARSWRVPTSETAGCCLFPTQLGRLSPAPGRAPSPRVWDSPVPHHGKCSSSLGAAAVTSVSAPQAQREAGEQALGAAAGSPGPGATVTQDTPPSPRDSAPKPGGGDGGL